jgi:hypothetical protein
MSSYAASARIVSVRPHLRALGVGADSTGAIEPESSQAVATATRWSEASASIGGSMNTALRPAPAGPVIDPIDDDPSTWLERISTSWGQLTWYLFNPEGWR